MTLNIDIEHFKARLLQDALTQATAAHWDHQADVWEAAAPQPHDRHGNATEADLAAAWRRCTDTAKACRRHAQLLTEQWQNPSETVSADIYEVLT